MPHSPHTHAHTYTHPQESVYEEEIGSNWRPGAGVVCAWPQPTALQVSGMPLSSCHSFHAFSQRDFAHFTSVRDSFGFA